VRLVILGGPGSGKGTQAERLSRHFNIPAIATGEILRAEITRQTALGQQAKPFVEKGELVPDPMMIQFIRDRLLQADVSHGWLLDGYPRTAFQAEELDFLLEEFNQRLHRAIWLEVPYPLLIQRSLQRQRRDDQLTVIQRRIELFEERSSPLLDYYEFRSLLLRVKGDQSIDAVQQAITEKLQ